MNGRVIWRILFTLIVVAALVGVGIWIYNVGVTQGMVSSGNLAAPNGAAPNGTTGVTPYPYYYAPFWHPWGWGFGFGFFPFGFIFPLLGFLLVFAILRRIFFRGPRGWGYWRGDDDPNQVPPHVREWHRRMHEEESADRTAAEEQK